MPSNINGVLFLIGFVFPIILNFVVFYALYKLLQAMSKRKIMKKWKKEDLDKQNIISCGYNMFGLPSSLIVQDKQQQNKIVYL